MQASIGIPSSHWNAEKLTSSKMNKDNFFIRGFLSVYETQYSFEGLQMPPIKIPIFVMRKENYAG
jgi:hypothetical protein